jgi:hypothetical protein
MTGAFKPKLKVLHVMFNQIAGIFLMPAYALQEFAWLYFAANRDRTNRRRLTSKRPDRCHVATPNR